MTHSGIPTNPNSSLSPEQQEEHSKKIMNMLISNNAQPNMSPVDLARMMGINAQPQHGHNHSHFPHGSQTEAKVNDSTVKKMDTDETLRVENLLLREQMEKMHQQLENLRRELAQKELMEKRHGLQDYLHDKHRVDLNTHKLIVDPQAHTLTISPLPVE